MPFVSGWSGVDVRWYHDRSSQDFSKLQWCVCVNNVWLVWRLEKFSKTLVRLLWSLCFARIGFNWFIDWQDLIPRLRIRNCFEMHFPHWGLSGMSLSSHQNFLPRYCFEMSPSEKDPLISCSSCRSRNFRLYLYFKRSIKRSLVSILELWLFSRHWSIVSLDRWPTHWNICGLCKAWAIGLRAFHRLSTRLQVTIVNEHLCLYVGVHFHACSHHYCKGSGPFNCPSLLSLIFLLIMCVDAPESTTNSRSCGLFEAIGVDITFASPINIFDKSSATRGRILRSFSEFWPARTAFMRRTILDDLSRCTLSFPNLVLVVPGALGVGRRFFIPFFYLHVE